MVRLADQATDSDLPVIGGGINGTDIAYDAVGRGLRSGWSLIHIQ